MGHSLPMASWYIDRMRTVRALPLPQAQHHLLMVLATYADKRGRAWPSVGTLSRDCGMSDKHIRTLLRALRKTKHLKAVGTGPKGVTTYEVGTHDMGTREVGTHDDTPDPTHDMGTPPTHEVGTKGTSEGAREKEPPSPRQAGVLKLVKVMRSHIQEHGVDGFDPDSPESLANVAASCGDIPGVSGRQTWVEQAMRIALGGEG